MEKKCKLCGIVKPRIHSGTYDGINKKWIDEKGKQWSGKTCPDCHRTRTAGNMRKLRKDTNG